MELKGVGCAVPLFDSRAIFATAPSTCATHLAPGDAEEPNVHSFRPHVNLVLVVATYRSPGQTSGI